MGGAHYGGGGLGDECLRRIDRWPVMSGSVVWFVWEERRVREGTVFVVESRERESCKKKKKCKT